MSRTRMPANGSVGESAAAVARPLQREHFEPLSRMRGLRCLIRLKDVLEAAIVHQTKLLKRRNRQRLMKSCYVVQAINGTSASGAEIFPQCHHFKCLLTYLQFSHTSYSPSSIMFTGIVEVTGSTSLPPFSQPAILSAKLTQLAVTRLEKQDDTAAGGGGTSLTISDCAEILTDAHLGDSISINGTPAQTASHPSPSSFPTSSLLLPFVPSLPLHPETSPSAS